MRKRATVLLSLCIFLSCTEENQKTGFCFLIQNLRVNGNALEISYGGGQETAVVFESGLGVDRNTWFENDLFERIGERHQVVAYSRAGYPSSTYNDTDRNIEVLSNDLAQVIELTVNSDQVILVGHSMGAGIIRHYAINNPEKIKGILFIDPSHEKYSPYKNMTQREEDEIVRSYMEQRNIGGAIEAKQLLENRDILESLPNLPDVPIIVLTATLVDNNISAAERLDWSNAHACLEQGVSDFNQIETPQNGHFIYLENSSWIIELINQLHLK